MRGVLFLLPFALSCGDPFSDRGEILCAHEGEVSFAVRAVHATEAELFLSGEIRWQPCPGPSRSRDGIWRVDPGTAAIERVASVPSEAAVVAHPYEHTFDPGIVSTLNLVSWTSVGDEELAIGRLTGPGPTPGMNRTIWLDVSR